MPRIAKSGKKVALIGIENAYSLGTDIKRVKEFYDRGGRYMSLAHNGHSQFADSNTGERDGKWLHNGLSEMGKQVIAEMNKWGIMVDLSHPSKAANMQALALSKAPVIASHSAARALADHSRNMDDEQLEALKKNGGVIQTVAFASYVKIAKPDSPERAAAIAALRKEFGLPAPGGGGPGGGGGGGGRGGLNALTPEQRAKYNARMAEIDKKTPGDPRATVADFVNHIDYLVKKIGIDHVGISSDFDGGGGVTGWNGAEETFNVTLELVRRGYTEEQIGKIWSGNLLRVMAEVEKVAKQIQARKSRTVIQTALSRDLQDAIDFHEAVLAEGARRWSATTPRRPWPTSSCFRRFRPPTTSAVRAPGQRRQPAAARRARRRQDVLRRDPLGDQRREVRAHPGPRRSAADRGRRLPDDQSVEPGQLVTEFGPMASAEVILLDEINRIPLKSQSAFLEALQDRTITVGKETYDLPAFSFAIATMNPVELGQGTFPLSEAATDRFAVMVNIGYLPPEEEEKLVNFDFKQVRLNPLLSKQRIIELRALINREGVPARSARPLHPAAGGGDAAASIPIPTGACTRRRIWSSAASIWARHRARSSAGAGSPRCGRCCSAAAPKCFRKTSRISRRSCSAIASGSARMPPRTA